MTNLSGMHFSFYGGLLLLYHQVSFAYRKKRLKGPHYLLLGVGGSKTKRIKKLKAKYGPSDWRW